MARKRKPSGQKRKRSRSVGSFRRQPGNRPPGKIILIVCEGTNTEPDYFNEMRKSLRLSTVQVEIVGDCCDSDPVPIVNYALDAKRKRDALVKRGTSDPAYDYIWCVMDVENPIHRTTLNDALNIASGHSYLNIALSNPSFEYWLLLHFTETTRIFANAAEVTRELENFDPNYRRNKKISDYELLFSKTEEAIERAERILKNHESDEFAPNPSTLVHRLVKIIKSLAR